MMAFQAEGKAWGKERKMTIFEQNSLVWQQDGFQADKKAMWLGKWTEVWSKEPLVPG